MTSRSGVADGTFVCLRLDDFQAHSTGMARALDLARRATRTAVPLLIEGEAGTGKAALAHAVHGVGQRRARSFVRLDCGIEDDRLTEVLGASRARSAGTTLYLAEVGQMTARGQSALADLLHQQAAARGHGGMQRLRIIAGSRQPLLDLVRGGRFGEALYYRLAVTPIALPALRDRRDDIPALAAALLGARVDAEVPALGEGAIEWILAQPWPGNVAQLARVVRRAAHRAPGAPIEAAHLHAAHDGATGWEQPGPPDAIHGTDAAVRTLPEPMALLNAHGEVRRLADIEAGVIRFALQHYDGHMSEVSRRLGIGRSTLYRKLRELGLSHETVGPSP